MLCRPSQHHCHSSSHQTSLRVPTALVLAPQQHPVAAAAPKAQQPSAVHLCLAPRVATARELRLRGCSESSSWSTTFKRPPAAQPAATASLRARQLLLANSSWVSGCSRVAWVWLCAPHAACLAVKPTKTSSSSMLAVCGAAVALLLVRRIVVACATCSLQPVLQAVWWPGGGGKAGACLSMYALHVPCHAFNM